MLKKWPREEAEEGLIDAELRGPAVLVVVLDREQPRLQQEPLELLEVQHLSASSTVRLTVEVKDRSCIILAML